MALNEFASPAPCKCKSAAADDPCDGSATLGAHVALGLADAQRAPPGVGTSCAPHPTRAHAQERRQTEQQRPRAAPSCDDARDGPARPCPRSLFSTTKATNMMMVVAVLEGVCSFLAAETWLRTGPRPTMMDTELHAAGGYVCLPHNRYRSHVVQSRGLQLAAAEAAQQRNYPPQGPSRGSSQLWCMTSDRHVVSGRPLENSISYRNMAL